MAGNFEQEDLPVLIIGAGTCGLAIAHGLHINNIPYKLFEKDSALGTRNNRDWAFGCHWSRPILASLLGPAGWARVERAALVDPGLPRVETDVINVFNGATGERAGAVPTPGVSRFLRSRLRGLIAEGIGGSEGVAEFGKTVVGVSYEYGDGSKTRKSVTAHFGDGTSARGRLLIGADGSQSALRSILLGAPAASLKRLSLVSTFINATYPHELALYLRSFHPIFNLILHPENMVGFLGTLDAADPDKPETWRFTFYISWPSDLEEQAANKEKERGWGVKERLRQIRERARGWGEPLRSAFEGLEEDHAEVYYGALADWDPSLEGHAWDNRGGLVTLVGDAAHPMTYHRGQGLNHALADAGKLVELLSHANNTTNTTNPHKSQADLITAYETEMRARAGAEVRLSEMNSIMLHDYARVSESPLMKQGMSIGTGHGGEGGEGKTAAE
ncbi:Uu.00g094220.m01.CDS01 [Anthostomella pinea]|uniref:Uu.00g094220.m01.CDS01 n=1 Tax=Anthostomella pinea TaxID=933095 RepID=A0AAI8YKI5_9PEZI|nr:Uu.00g094220.m01.CDS01 [Anthostomella pinea]